MYNINKINEYLYSIEYTYKCIINIKLLLPLKIVVTLLIDRLHWTYD